VSDPSSDFTRSYPRAPGCPPSGSLSLSPCKIGSQSSKRHFILGVPPYSSSVVWSLIVLSFPMSCWIFVFFSDLRAFFLARVAGVVRPCAASPANRVSNGSAAPQATVSPFVYESGASFRVIPRPLSALRQPERVKLKSLERGHSPSLLPTSISLFPVCLRDSFLCPLKIFIAVKPSLNLPSFGFPKSFFF